MKEEKGGAGACVGEELEDEGPNAQQSSRESSGGMAGTATRERKPGTTMSERKPGTTAARLPSLVFWWAQRALSSGVVEWKKRQTAREHLAGGGVPGEEIGWRHCRPTRSVSIASFPF